MKEKTLRGSMSFVAIGLASLLSGCSNLDLLNPKGSVGVAERDLIATSTWAMLIVVIPVILMTLFFAWRYRASNTSAEYRPDWSHSTAIEVVVWVVPTLIILFLGVLTWKSTHELDPYRPLESQVKPINVEVVSLDWKWLFIYPDLGIATVNQVAFPVGTPVNFNITSDSVMNSFFIPQLGSQIYAMAGMQTRLHLIADDAGNYAGLSANFSGNGFSDMKFRALAESPADFDKWVAQVRASTDHLDMNRYNTLTQPGGKVPVTYFSSVDPKLFENIVAKYNNGHFVNFGASCGSKG
jgi:cytochrome o ubiquinol oxidase subunit 2